MKKYVYCAVPVLALLAACGGGKPSYQEVSAPERAVQIVLYQPNLHENSVATDSAISDETAEILEMPETAETLELTPTLPKAPPETHTLTPEGIALAQDFLQDFWRLFSNNVGWRDHETGELYVQVETWRESEWWSGYFTNFEPNIPIEQLPEGTQIPLFFTNATAQTSQWWSDEDGPRFVSINWWHDTPELAGYYNAEGERLTPPVLTHGRWSQWGQERWILGWSALDAMSVYLFDFQGNGVPDILVNFGGWLMGHSHLNGVGGAGGAEGVLFSYIDGAFQPVLYVSRFSTTFFRDTGGNLLVLQHLNGYEGNPDHHVPPGFHQISWDTQGVSLTPVLLAGWENHDSWSEHFWGSQPGVPSFELNPTLPESGEPLVQVWPLSELMQGLVAELRYADGRVFINEVN